MNKYKSQSTIIPKEWDTTSSSTTVYHNTNVVELQPKEDAPIMYEYDVEQYTKPEYESIVVAQTRADIDYLAIMTEVTL